MDNRHTACMTIDLKKYRIRLHKDTLHTIGDPAYVQLLVNVKEGMMAIRAVERGTPGSLAHKINPARMESEWSIEIYSHFFIGRLNTTFRCFEENCLYRLTGSAISEKRIALFSIADAQRVESDET